jgi:uncharacterized protein
VSDHFGVGRTSVQPASDLAAADHAARRQLAGEQFIVGRVEDVGFASALVRLDRAASDRAKLQGDAALALSGAVGSQIKIKAGTMWLLGNVRQTRVDDGPGGAILASVDFLGEGDEGADGSLRNFRRGITRYPRAGDAVVAVNHGDLVQLFGAGDTAHIEIGNVYPTSDVRASLIIDALLGKHFALMGSTGSGKSTATALILHRIIDMAPDGHIIVLDPHGEYRAAFATRGKLFNVDNLNLPYWLMNFEEHCEVFITSEGVERELDKAILATCLLQARAKNDLARTYRSLTVDSPIPYLLKDLLDALGAQMGKLSNSNEISRYVRLQNRIEEILRDQRYTFMFNTALAGDGMKEFLIRMLRLPAEGQPISIVDLSGVPSDIIAVVVALIARITMDHAIWSRAERQRPVLLVCEEAHHYIPSERIATNSAVRKILERIAKEGRKYGVSLGLVTQRPSDLAEGVLSQCGTIISMRLNNERDQTCVRNAMPEGGRSFLDAIPALRRGECIISGEGVAIPVRVRFDDLAAHLRPRSEDLMFSELWNQVGDESGALDRTIGRWRSQSDRAAEPVLAPTDAGSFLLLKPDPGVLQPVQL